MMKQFLRSLFCLLFSMFLLLQGPGVAAASPISTESATVPHLAFIGPLVVRIFSLWGPRAIPLIETVEGIGIPAAEAVATEAEIVTAAEVAAAEATAVEVAAAEATAVEVAAGANVMRAVDAISQGVITAEALSYVVEKFQEQRASSGKALDACMPIIIQPEGSNEKFVAYASDTCE